MPNLLVLIAGLILVAIIALVIIYVFGSIASYIDKSKQKNELKEVLEYLQIYGWNVTINENANQELNSPVIFSKKYKSGFLHVVRNKKSISMDIFYSTPDEILEMSNIRIHRDTLKEMNRYLDLMI